MTLTYVGSAIGSISGGYWRKVDAPAHNVGDLLLVNNGWNNETQQNPTPTGWTYRNDLSARLATQYNPNANCYWRIADGSANDNWYMSTGAYMDQGYTTPTMVVYRGHVASNPIKRAIGFAATVQGLAPATVPTGKIYTVVGQLCSFPDAGAWTWDWNPPAQRVHSNQQMSLVLDKSILGGNSTGDSRTHQAGSWGTMGALWEIEENAPPTNPGAFTSPTAGISVDTLGTVSWGASTDPEGGAVTYSLWLTTNGGSSWTQTHSGLTTNSISYDYTNQPETTNAFWHVRSYDASGTTTNVYTQSPTFTISHGSYTPAMIL